jgi:hypothetical protein
MSRKLLFTLFLRFVLTLVVTGIALTQDDDEDDFTRVWDEDMGWVGMLDDGRLNAYDLDAPVAVYYTHPLLPGGAFGSAITGIEVYAINPRTGVGQAVLTLTNTEISSLLTEEGLVDQNIAAENGVSLNYSADGYFWVTATARDGHTYTFEWPDYTTRVLPVTSPAVTIAA